MMEDLYLAIGAAGIITIVIAVLGFSGTKTGFAMWGIGALLLILSKLLS